MIYSPVLTCFSGKRVSPEGILCIPEVRLLTTPDDHMLIAAEFSNLTPTQLFDHFTQPELLLKWWPQGAETDARIGGTYHLSWPGMSWHLRGIYCEFIPGERLVLTWAWDHQPELPERTVEMDIQPATNGSTIRLKHGTYGDDEVERADRQSHIDGWLHFLAQLQSLAS